MPNLPNARLLSDGSPVTRAELAAHLRPMRDDILEIKDGLNALIADRRERALLGERGRKILAGAASKTGIAITAGVVSAAITVASTYL